MKLPRILVCGSRHVDDSSKEEYMKVSRALNKICDDRGWAETDYLLPRVVIIQGACEKGGIDSLADQWAVVNWCQSIDFPPLPEDKRMWGYATACKMRNQRMLDIGEPDVVVAFPGGSGTADMVDRARRAGVEVIEICNTY